MGTACCIGRGAVADDEDDDEYKKPVNTIRRIKKTMILVYHISNLFIFLSFSHNSLLQCLDCVGWVTERASGL